MKRFKRFAAVLLSAAMVMTSFQVPVFAAPEEEIVVGGDSSVISEESSDAALEATVEDSAEKQAQETPDEGLTGAYTRYHIYNEDDLVSALNGKTAGGEEITLPSILEKNIELTKPLEVKANVTLDMNGKTIEAAVSYEEAAKKQMTLTVAAGNTLTLEGNGTLALNVVNSGTYIQNGSVNIRPEYGVPFTNNSGENVEAILRAGSLTYRNQADEKEEKNVIVNSANMTINGSVSLGYSYGSDSDDFQLVNNGNAKLNYFNTSYNSYRVKNSGYLLSKGYIYELYNDGESATVEQNDGSISELLVTYNGASVVMNGGSISTLDMDVQIHASPLNGTATSGNFTMNGGTVYKINYITNVPKLLGGQVGRYRHEYYDDDDAAISHYIKEGDSYTVSENTAEFKTNDEKGTEVTVKAIQHQEEPVSEDGKSVDKVVERPATLIINGVVQDYYQEDSGLVTDGIEVSSNKALVEAINSAPTGEVTKIYRVRGDKWYDNASISANVVVRKDQKIELYNRSTWDSIPFISGVSFTVEEGAEFTSKVSFSGGGVQSGFLVNNGTVLFDGANVQAVSGNVIVNNKSGVLTLDDSRVYVTRDSDCLLVNYGTVSIEDTVVYTGAVSANAIVCEADSTTTVKGTSVIETTGRDSFPVYIKDKANFVYDGYEDSYIINDYEGEAVGSISPYAIVYENDSVPVLRGGYVASYVMAFDKTTGFAVAKLSNGQFESGSIKGADGNTVDTKKANIIVNGVPRYDSEFGFVQHYILLKTAEVYSLSSNFVINENYYTNIAYKIIDNASGAITYDEATSSITAAKAGYAVIKVFATSKDDKDNNKVVEVADYLRVEVTDKDIASLTADDYEGVLLEPNMTLNAYRKDFTFDFGFNLKTSRPDMTGESVTGGNQEIDEQTFRPIKVYTDDDEFNEYFEAKKTKYLIGNDRKYSIKFNVKSNGNGDRESSLISEHEIKAISDIQWYVDLEAIVNGERKTIEKVPFRNKMNVTIDQKKPTVKFDKITLNSAYNSFTGENNFDILTGFRTQSGEYYAVAWADSYSDGLSVKVVNGYDDEYEYVSRAGYLAYVGTAKKAKQSLYVHYNIWDKNGHEYYGEYAATIPVEVSYKQPKVDLESKSLSVAEKAADAGVIYIPLKSNVQTDFGKVQSIKLDEENEYFESTFTSRSTGTQIKKYFVNSSMLTLKQKKDLPAKGVKLTFTVTYNNVKPGKGGKEYTTKFTLTLKKDKFTVKPTLKSYVLKADSDSVDVELKTTPSNYKGGVIKVTDPTEGKLTISNATGNSGSYDLTIGTNDKTKEITAKKIVLPVTFYGNDGTAQASGKITVNLDKAEYDITLKKSVLKMDINKEAIYAKTDGWDYIYGGINLGDEWTTYNVKVEKGDFMLGTTIYSMKTAVPVNKKGLRWENYAECSDQRFIIRTDAKGNFELVPSAQALIDGSILPNTEYKMTLTFYDITDKSYKRPLTVVTSGIKSVKTLTSTKTVTLYQKAPYYEADVTIKGVKPFNAEIKSVTCDNPNFEIRTEDMNYAYNTYFGYWYDEDDDGYVVNNIYNDDYATFKLAYKNHTSKGIDAKKQKVKLTVTYTNGATGSVTITVDCKDSTNTKKR